MKVILIAAMDRNGTIGRTSKACPKCTGRGQFSDDYEAYPCWACREEGTSTLRGSTGRVPANDVPWSYPELDAHFDRMTMGHAVIMGRRTWESRGGRPLNGRTNIVLTSAESALAERYYHVGGWHSRTSLPAALRACHGWEKEKAYIIGGARLFAAALPLADELDLTLIDHAFEGGVRFPWSADAKRAASDLNPWAAYEFIETHGVRFDLVEQRQGSTPELTFTRWVRRCPRRLTIVLDESVTETECRDCEFGENRGIVRGRDVFSCALFDHKDVTDSRLPECLEAERAAARMVEIDPNDAAIERSLDPLNAEQHEAVRRVHDALTRHAQKAAR